MKSMRSIAVVLLALGLGRSAEAKVSARAISELIRSADAIVLASVVRVGGSKRASGRKSSKVTVALAKVLERWKGEVHETVEFSLERAWDCDVSGAVVDEKVVLFLDKKYRGPETVTIVPGVFHLAFWGRGRMPIVQQVGRELVRVQGEILLPKQELESGKSSELPGDNLVELDKLRAHVQALIAASAGQTPPRM